jgi:hypothetical protein
MQKDVAELQGLVRLLPPETPMFGQPTINLFGPTPNTVVETNAQTDDEPLALPSMYS